jgi:succinoglycan biosynthesis transport protein ExoP
VAAGEVDRIDECHSSPDLAGLLLATTAQPDLRIIVTLSGLLQILRHRWRIVLVSVLVGVATGGLYSFLQTPEYSSSTQLFVSTTEAGNNNGDLNQGGTFTQQRVRSYVDIVDSPLVAEKVIRQLELPYSAEDFAEKVEVTSPLDSVLINIVVTDSASGRARDIANAIAEEFPRLVAEIETSSGQSISPVKASVTRPAVESRRPVSPKTELNIILGLLGGLIVGAGLAVAGQAMDKSVRTADDLSRLTSAPVLSMVPFESGASKSPLMVEGSAQSARAEAMRRLRTNLQFVNVDRPLKSLVVTSAVPGEGKSTLTCNLGIAFAEAGKRVLLVDADLRRPKLAEYLDLEGAVGLTNVLAGQASIRDALQQWGGTGLWVLPSGYVPPNPSEILASRNMTDLLTALSGGFDIVIIDTPPLLPVTDGAVMATVADGCLLVSRHGKTKATQAAAAANALSAVGARLHGSVLNMAPRKGSGAYSYYSYSPTEAVTAPAVPVTPLPQQSVGPAPQQPVTTVSPTRVRAVTAAPVSRPSPTGRHGRTAVPEAPTTEIQLPNVYRSGGTATRNGNGDYTVNSPRQP